MPQTADLETTSLPHERGLALKVWIMLVLTLLLMAVFQSGALVTLSYDLPPGGMNERVIGAAEFWHRWMSDAGAAGITDWVSGFIAGLHQHVI